MSDDEIKLAIRYVADAAYDIAFDGKASGEVCRAIEALSDDPEREAELIKEIKTDARWLRNKV